MARKRVIGFYTDKRGRVRPITAKTRRMMVRYASTRGRPKGEQVLVLRESELMKKVTWEPYAERWGMNPRDVWYRIEWYPEKGYFLVKDITAGEGRRVTLEEIKRSENLEGYREFVKLFKEMRKGQ